MKPHYSLFAALFLIGCGLIWSGCEKNDQSQAEALEGLWNIQTIEAGRVCNGTMTIEAITDNKIKMIYNNCLGSYAIADINGNSIVIPKQTNSDYGHQGSGTVTENSISFPTYRAYRFGNVMYILKLTATK